MWCDQAKSVGRQKYWFYDTAKQNRKWAIVFGILQLLISLEPIDQFQWGFLQNVAVKMVHTVSWKNENWNWPTSDWFCLITPHIMLIIESRFRLTLISFVREKKDLCAQKIHLIVLNRPIHCWLQAGQILFWPQKWLKPVKKLKACQNLY